MMPVVARTLTQRQWDDVEQREFVATKTKRELGIEAHWLIHGVDRDDYDVTVHKVGPVTRLILLHAFNDRIAEPAPPVGCRLGRGPPRRSRRRSR